MNNITFDQIKKKLVTDAFFKEAKLIDNEVPDEPGFYCIMVKNPNKLPEPFASILIERNSNIIYTGLASKSLRSRFLGQELRGKSHGTFFRSLGAVLGYQPLAGSLRNKKNKQNFKFKKDDEIEIINWINHELLVNWLTCSSELYDLETLLIETYTPILNLAKNRNKMPELSRLRKKCVEIANQ